MDRLSQAYGRVLDGLMLLACLLLLAMTLLIGTDVATRNIGAGGIPWSGEVSENILYLLTLLAAPWLLRQGQHIRVDILLRAVPKALGWAFEWIVDALALGCCAAIAYYGARAAFASYSAGSMSIKTLITPEWWLLSVLPLAFVALTIEMLFRMRRLYLAPRAPRDDAVSTG
jgi:TRAP-type C4-dicarboxylate transport system permease small subunit